MKHTPGHCPKCDSTNLEYGTSEYYDNDVGCWFTCSDCGFEGEEIFHLVFACFDDANGNEVPGNSEHDPEICGCKYLGNNIWSCGHIDQL